MAQALQALKNKKYSYTLSDDEINWLTTTYSRRQKPEKLKQISTKALATSFRRSPLKFEGELPKLPKALLEDVVEELSFGQLFYYPNELTSQLNVLLRSGVMVRHVGLPRGANQEELNEFISHLPSLCPQLTTLSCYYVGYEIKDEEVDISSTWECMEQLQVAKLPGKYLSILFFRVLKNISVLECQAGRTGIVRFESDMLAISSLQNLSDLRLAVARSVPSSVAGARLARLVGQLPALRKIYCGRRPFSDKDCYDRSSIASVFVSSVEPFLKHRINKLQLLHLDVNNRKLESIIFPMKLQLHNLYVSGPLEEEAVRALREANCELLVHFDAKEVQASALYELMPRLGPNLKHLHLETDQQPLELHRLLAPAPNLEHFELEPYNVCLADPLPCELDMICGKKMSFFYADNNALFGIEQQEIVGKYLKHYLQQTESVSILEYVYTDSIIPTLEALRSDPLCCSQVNVAHLYIFDREYLIGPAAELTTLLALRSPSLQSVEWSIVDDSEWDISFCLEMKENHAWFLHFLHETGFTVIM